MLHTAGALEELKKRSGQCVKVTFFVFSQEKSPQTFNIEISPWTVLGKCESQEEPQFPFP